MLGEERRFVLALGTNLGLRSLVLGEFWVSAIPLIQGFHLPTLLKVCIGSFKIRNAALCGAGIKSQKGMSNV